MKRIYKMMLVGTMILSVTMISKQGMEQVTAASKPGRVTKVKKKVKYSSYKGWKSTADRKMRKIKYRYGYTISWKKIKGVSGYDVERYGVASMKWHLIKTTKKTKFILTNLNDAKVKLRVRAFKMANGQKVYGASSSSLNFKAKYCTKIYKNAKTKPYFDRFSDEEAFVVQNKKYRNKVGAVSLGWSEVQYQLARYRLKTSGFDSHKNMIGDYSDFLGGFFDTVNTTDKLTENLYIGGGGKDACRGWKRSPGHYRAMINRSYQSGAIACYDTTVIGIYAELGANEFDTKFNSFQDTNAKIVVRRQDSATGQYINAYGSTFVIRDMETGEQKAYGFPKNKTEKEIYICLTGKQYRIYETIPPNGYSKAKGQTFTAQAARDGTMYITLTD